MVLNILIELCFTTADMLHILNPLLLRIGSQRNHYFDVVSIGKLLELSIVVINTIIIFQQFSSDIHLIFTTFFLNTP